MGIRNHKDIKYIGESGGERFFLGSTILQYYDEPKKMIETIHTFKEAGASI